MSQRFMSVGVGNTTLRFGLATHSETWPVRWDDRLDIPCAGFEGRLLEPIVPPQPVDWYLASVNRPAADELTRWVREVRPGDRMRICGHDDLSLRVAVPTPGLVGIDRLVAAASANRLRHPSRNALVVDAGTALTVNLVDSLGVFRGGAICPGAGMMAAALADGTDLLPRVRLDIHQSSPPLSGDNTALAIQSGVFHGLIGVVEEFVRRHRAVDQRIEVFLTGGDAVWISSQIRCEHRLIDDLGLQGIAIIASGRDAPLA